MLINRARVAAGSPGILIGTLGAMADAGGDAMRSMAMDPVSATRQTLAAVRRHPYIAAVLLLGLGVIIAGFAGS